MKRCLSFGRATLACVVAVLVTASAHAQAANEIECTFNWQCTSGYYCEKPAGDCAGNGVCIEIPPGVCPPVWAPVCGCNGQTYGNSCEAAASGVNVSYEGECIDIACQQNPDCPGGFWCLKNEGDCGGQGTCMPVGEGICILVYAPVCGCDGQTYGNWCFAWSNGVNIAHQGECGTGAICSDIGDCPPGEFCATPDGKCDAQGLCAPKPEICPLVYNPVCGCDGATYGSQCFANAHGVSVLHAGACEVDAGGIASSCSAENPCSAGYWCSTPVGECGGEGTCAQSFPPDQLACPDVWMPVCGCDGVTYSNECYAFLAGVSLSHAGECGSDNGGGNCPADLTGDGLVGVFDLLQLLSKWGPCPTPCPADFTGDGNVSVFDLLGLLSNWGPCP